MDTVDKPEIPRFAGFLATSLRKKSRFSWRTGRNPPSGTRIYRGRGDSLTGTQPPCPQRCGEAGWISTALSLWTNPCKIKREGGYPQHPHPLLRLRKYNSLHSLMGGLRAMQFTTNVQLLLDGLNTVTRALSARPTKTDFRGRAPFRRGRACETDLL